MANIFGDMPGAGLVAETESDRGAGRTAGAGCAGRAWIGSAFLLLLGCGSGGVPSDGEGEATRQKAAAVIADLQDPPPPMNKMYSFNVVDGQARDVRMTDVPGAAEPFGQPKQSQPVTLGPRMGKRLSDDVDAVETRKAQDRAVDVIVSFKENLWMPRFPARKQNEPRDSAANVAAQARADQLVNAIQAFRTPGYNALAKELAAGLGAKEKERFWLTNAMTVEMSLSKIRELVARDDVQYVEYTLGGSLPSDPPGYDISDGRAVMQSDPYYGYATPWIGMVDSGIFPHTLVYNMFDYYRDCIRGTADSCTTGTGLQPFDTDGHGTASASILSGNNDLGNPSRGVTQITVDSWKACEGVCWSDAGMRAMLSAVTSGDSVIMVNMQATEADSSNLSRTADSAFDMGAVVVAAAGNFGPISGSVTAPGNAHKVLAVGAIDVHTCFDPRRSARNWPGKSARDSVG